MGLKPTKNKSKPRIKCVWDAQKQKMLLRFFLKRKYFFYNQCHFSLSDLILDTKLHKLVIGCYDNSTGWSFKNS